MAKQPSKIRWRDSDTAELQRVINNFNAKLYRLNKNNPDLAEFLPDRVKKSEVIKSIETRADFNRVLNSYKRFSKRGAEAPVKSSRGAKSTQWEVDEFKQKQRIENARRTRERKKLNEQEVKIAGKGTGVKRAEMGSVKENALKPSRKNFNNMSQKEWVLATANIDKMLDASYREERLVLMRENYLKGLTEQGFLDDSPELEEYIRGLDLQKFHDTVQTDETGTFMFYKDPIAYEARREALINTWRTAFEGK